MSAEGIRPAQANHVFLPPLTQPGGNNPDSRRIALIAIPIIIALTSFFFLPATISFVITAVVTVGALVYKNNNNITPLQSPISQAPINDCKELPSESTPFTKPKKLLIHSTPKPKTPGITKATNPRVPTKDKPSSKPSATTPISSEPSIEGNPIPSDRFTPKLQTPQITTTTNTVLFTRGKASSKLSATKPISSEPFTQSNSIPSYRFTPKLQTPVITRTIPRSASVNDQQRLQSPPTPLFTSKANLFEPQSTPLTPILRKIKLRTTGMVTYPPTIYMIFKTINDRTEFCNEYGDKFSKRFRLVDKDSPTRPGLHIYWRSKFRKADNTANTLNILKEIFGEAVVKEKCQVPEHLDTSLLPNWMGNKRNAVLKTPSEKLS